MPRFGGIPLVEITFTFLDGRQLTYLDVEYMRKTECYTLLLSPTKRLEVPLAALRHVQWTLAAPEEE